MVTVAAWAEHRVKLSASPGEGGAKKRPFPLVAPPPAFDHGDLPATRQAKGGDVQRVAEGVLGKRASAIAVAPPAAIGGDLSYAHHRLAEIPSGRQRGDAS